MAKSWVYGYNEHFELRPFWYNVNPTNGIHMPVQINQLDPLGRSGAIHARIRQNSIVSVIYDGLQSSLKITAIFIYWQLGQPQYDIVRIILPVETKIKRQRTEILGNHPKKI